MARLVLTAAARDDLIAIANFIETNGEGLTSAERFVGKLLGHCQKLASSPTIMGRARPELLPNLRSVPSGKYVIFLRYTQEVGGLEMLEIVNILHGRRDIDAFFSEKDE